MTRPIVFLTDYGLADEFVGICHGVIAKIAPDARVIDLTHAIARQDVTRGALTLERAEPYMPSDAVWVAVVDPGVGSDRREIAVRTASGAYLVGPDNGVLSLLWKRQGGAEEAVVITSPAVLVRPVSRTFHGRDAFAPAGAHLAAGAALADLGPVIDVASLVTLDIGDPEVSAGSLRTNVTIVDGFGNVQLNAWNEHLVAAGFSSELLLDGRRIPLVGVFSDVAEGALAAIIDSQGFLALVVNKGSAATELGLGPGDEVVLG